MKKRSFPYIWVTWLAPLLSGDRSCEYAIWFKAHYQDYETTPREWNSAKWNEEHTALLTEMRDGFSSDAIVHLEDQNAFKLEGDTAIVAGKPDLINCHGPYADVWDAKTGKPKDSDITQIQIYLYALPRCRPIYRNAIIKGNLRYADGQIVGVPTESVDTAFIARFGQLVRRVAGSTEARAVPSVRECGFCDIAACPYRISNEENTGTTEDF